MTSNATAQVIWLQGLTISWMLVECSVSLSAAWRSHSVALLAFGSDSLVELLSATVVLLQFAPRIQLDQKRAARWSAVLLFLLAGVLTLPSLFALARGSRADTSASGMMITAGALVMMPTLAFFKRSKAQQLDNRALAADAVQSATCAYLAAVTLGSLALNAVFRMAWIDSLAALLTLPLLVAEGRRAWRGDGCCCH